MTRRAPAEHIHFVDLGLVAGTGIPLHEYTIEIRAGRCDRPSFTTRTVGRVYGTAGSWCALHVGARAWTRRHATRRAAVAAMFAGELCTESATWVTAA